MRVTGGNDEASEYRQARSVRQRTSRPCDSIGERVSFHSNFHSSTPLHAGLLVRSGKDAQDRRRLTKTRGDIHGDVREGCVVIDE